MVNGIKKTSALGLAEEQYKAGTLSKKNKQTLLDTTKKNIATSGGDRSAGLEATRKQLSGLTTDKTPKESTPKIGSTSGVSSVGGLKKAKGYREGDVGVPGVNLYKEDVKPTDTTKGATNGLKDTKRLGDVSDVGDLTGKQDVPDDYDTKIKDLQNQLNEEGMTADELKETERQIKYYEDLKENQSYLEKQRKTQKEYDAISGEISEMQSSARLRRGQKSLKDLKTNIAYLGNMGQPAQSAGKLDAIDAQIEEGQKTYNDLRKTEELTAKARALGQESKADAFEKQMDDLQEQLDDNVSGALQDALDKIDNAEINGLLYDEDAMEDFRVKLLEDTDNTVAELSDRNFKRRAFLLDQYKTIAEESKIKEANKNKFTEHPGGYYVDGNGDPVISAITGTRIEIPENAPMKPVFDKETGMLTTFSLDENGNIVAQVQETYPEATFTESTIANYASLVAQGKLNIDDIPADVRGNDAFISALEKAEIPEDIKDTKNWSKLDDNRLYNERTGEVKDVTTGETTNIQAIDTQSIIDYSTKRRGRNNLQCGELVNDYWTQATGSRAGMGDTLESKVDALTSVGVSDEPIAGGLFVSNPLGNEVGHTGIVQVVNADGSIEVLEANASGLKDGEKPTTKTYTAEQAENMFFSKSPKAAEPELTRDFDKASVPQFVNYLQKGKIGTSATEVATIEEQFGSVEEFKRQAELYNNSPNGPRQKELDKINKLKGKVESFLLEENAGALSNSVGTVQTAMSPWTIRNKEAYLAGIQNFLDGKTLQNLIDVKAEGATFGALSNEELRMLQNSASALNQLALREDEKDPNRITGFRGSEANFKKVIQKTIDEYNTIINRKKEVMGKDTTETADPLGLGIEGGSDPLNLGL